jgi:hypothetical protein
MISFKKYHATYSLLTEAKAGKSSGHLTHLEELMLTKGESGYDEARDTLMRMLSKLQGRSKRNIDTTVKWDGAPFIIAGKITQDMMGPNAKIPVTGKHFVATKSGITNKEPKINYDEGDIINNHGHAPGLVEKLKQVLKATKQMGIKGVIGGDVMFDSSILKPMVVDGEELITFKPNPNGILYGVPKDSEFGKDILNSTLGIIWHSKYSDISDAGRQPFSNSEFKRLRKVPGVWMDDAEFTDSTGIVTLEPDEVKQVRAYIKQADNLKVNFKKLGTVLPLINIYLNSEIRDGSFIDDPEKSFKNFIEWHKVRDQKGIDKVKTQKHKLAKANVSKEKIASLVNNKESIINLFKKSKAVQSAKQIFINKYNNAVYNFKHFLDNGDGTLKASNPEGYVAVSKLKGGGQNSVKFVDRLEFSRANFGGGGAAKKSYS